MNTHQKTETQAVVKSKEQELLEACKLLVGWFNHPSIRFKMCDGGKGNLGEQSEYHRMMKQARDAIYKAEYK